MIDPMQQILVIIGGILFLSGSASWLLVKIWMRPPQDDLPAWHEMEDRDPRLTRYNRYSRLCIVGATIGALLIFLGTV